MSELIIAIREYAGWLYAVLALFMIRELLAMRRSSRLRDVALFGLERDAASGRAVRSLVTMFLLVTIGVGVYIVSNVLAPALPEESARRARDDAPLLETPPTVMLPTDTATPPPATPTRRPGRIVTAPPEPSPAPGDVVSAALCRPENLEILAPAAGAAVGAGTEVVVTVRFQAGEGRRFWLELGAGASPAAWRALGPERTEPVERAAVAQLPTDLAPGPYVLRLVLSGGNGEDPANAVCAVPLRVP